MRSCGCQHFRNAFFTLCFRVLRTHGQGTMQIFVKVSLSCLVTAFSGSVVFLKLSAEFRRAACFVVCAHGHLWQYFEDFTPILFHRPSRVRPSLWMWSPATRLRSVFRCVLCGCLRFCGVEHALEQLQPCDMIGTILSNYWHVVQQYALCVCFCCLHCVVLSPVKSTSLCGFCIGE